MDDDGGGLVFVIFDVEAKQTLHKSFLYVLQHLRTTFPNVYYRNTVRVCIDN